MTNDTDFHIINSLWGVKRRTDGNRKYRFEYVLCAAVFEFHENTSRHTSMHFFRNWIDGQHKTNANIIARLKPTTSIDIQSSGCTILITLESTKQTIVCIYSALYISCFMKYIKCDRAVLTARHLSRRISDLRLLQVNDGVFILGVLCIDCQLTTCG